MSDPIGTTSTTTTTANAVSFSDDTKPAAVVPSRNSTERKMPVPDFDFDAEDFDAAKFTTFLTQEQPSVDAALKSYASWIAATQPAVTALHATAGAAAAAAAAASASTGSTSINYGDTYGDDGGDDDDDDSYALIPTAWSLAEILSMTRHLSRQINQHTFAVRRVESVRYSETSKVWNNVVGQAAAAGGAGGLKPTRVLGRSSLQLAWPDLDLTWCSSDNEKTRCSGHTDTAIDTIADANDVLLRQKTSLFVRRFGELLLSESDQQRADARLIWDTDKGQTELQRRAVERNQRAAANAKQQEARQQAALKQVVNEGLTIEELPDEDAAAEQES